MYNAALIKMQKGLSALVGKIGELAERPMYIPVEYFDFTYDKVRPRIAGTTFTDSCKITAINGNDLTVMAYNHGFSYRDHVIVIQRGLSAHGDVYPIDANTFTLTLQRASSVVADVAFMAKIPRLRLNNDTYTGHTNTLVNVTSGELENISTFRLQSFSITFDTNCRSGTTFALTFPQPFTEDLNYRSAVFAGRQNSAANAAFALTVGKLQVGGVTTGITFGSLPAASVPLALDMRF